MEWQWVDRFWKESPPPKGGHAGQTLFLWFTPESQAGEHMWLWKPSQRGARWAWVAFPCRERAKLLLSPGVSHSGVGATCCLPQCAVSSPEPSLMALFPLDFQILREILVQILNKCLRHAWRNKPCFLYLNSSIISGLVNFPVSPESQCHLGWHSHTGWWPCKVVKAGRPCWPNLTVSRVS